MLEDKGGPIVYIRTGGTNEYCRHSNLYCHGSASLDLGSRDKEQVKDGGDLAGSNSRNLIPLRILSCISAHFEVVTIEPALDDTRKLFGGFPFFDVSVFSLTAIWTIDGDDRLRRPQQNGSSE